MYFVRFDKGWPRDWSLFSCCSARESPAHRTTTCSSIRPRGRARRSKTRTAMNVIAGRCSRPGLIRASHRPRTPSRLNSHQPSKPHVLQGAGRGAALGAVGGAITGNAGKGAAAGAAMGGLAGGFRRRDERLRQADVQADRAAAGNPARPAYMRAMAACLQGRGYTVN